ncbi:7-methylguanosine phosphate-specific 5'-nucleotidase [Schistosoma japonicum]|nr:7-methylguanosine phosphate-specific 5'-nucleotidase [Schistosoma japonicum]
MHGNRLVHVSPILVNKLADFIYHGPEYVQLKELSDFYSPFETSPDMYAYEKSCLMKEFWNLAHKALVDGNVSREDIDCCVMEGGIGRLVGFQDPIIHCCNKTYDVLRNTEYFETTLSKRMCILLIGDSASDANMVDDRQTFSCEEVVNDEKLKLFSSLYDLILLSDETFDVPLFILSSIFNIDEVCNHERKKKNFTNSNI